jgi:hypothetical protein
MYHAHHCFRRYAVHRETARVPLSTSGARTNAFASVWALISSLPSRPVPPTRIALEVLIDSVQAGASGLFIVIRRWTDEAVDRGSSSRLPPRLPICKAGVRSFTRSCTEKRRWRHCVWTTRQYLLRKIVLRSALKVRIVLC